jgi:hypothetical protein
VRTEDAKELGEKQKAKNQGLEDFYRFQMRERRKEEQGEFLRKFEEDKRRLDEMKKRRGRLRVSYGRLLELRARSLTRSTAGVKIEEHDCTLDVSHWENWWARYGGLTLL